MENSTISKKNYKIAIITFMLFFNCYFNSYADTNKCDSDNGYNVEKFEYVCLQEFNNGKNVTNDWKLSKRSNKSDVESMIYINIDETKLENFYIKNNNTLISFSAELNGTPIEVSNYSKVGENIRAIDISNSIPTNSINNLIASSENVNKLISAINNAKIEDLEKINYEIITFIKIYKKINDIRVYNLYANKILDLDSTKLDIINKEIEKISVTNIDKEKINKQYKGIAITVNANTFIEPYSTPDDSQKFINNYVKKTNEVISSAKIIVNYIMPNINILKSSYASNDYIENPYPVGVIDLKRNSAKENDDIIIYQITKTSGTYYDIDGKVSNDNSFKKEEIFRFGVSDFGWHKNVVDSFLLIDKIKHENNHKVTEENSISNNFIGAPGVSMLFNYNTREGSFLKNISAGVNVSYLNFDKSTDIEFGSGIIIGFFDNMIHAGWGVNLNYPGTINDRQYWFLGFSFAKILEKYNGGSAEEIAQ